MRQGGKVHPIIPAQAQGCPGNGKGLLSFDRNQPKVVMRGLDLRIHGIAVIASTRCKDVDRRIRSGHDGPELHERHCALGSAPIAKREIQILQSLARSSYQAQALGLRLRG